MSSRARGRATKNIVLLAALMLLQPHGVNRAEDTTGDKEHSKTEGKVVESKDAGSLKPFVLDLTEAAGVTLLLLDVEVRDQKGHPLRGLRKEDFKVRLSGKEWPIYSVDDFCTCVDDSESGTARTVGGAGDSVSARKLGGVDNKSSASVAGGTEDRGSPRTVDSADHSGSASKAGSGDDKGSALTVGGAEDEARRGTGDVATAREQSPTDDPLRFVLFFNFGQLQMAGRFTALRDARRWIREVKQPGDEVMIAGHTERAGLTEICPFTTDASRLLSALEKAEHDPKLQDAFPSMLYLRVEECQRDPVTCTPHAHSEYLRTRNSLLALKDLLSTLEGIPGRKALIHFQENGIVFPGRIFRRQAWDQVRLLDEVGVEANLSRTSVHAAYVGDRLGALRGWEVQLTDGAVNLGSNLADFTGGTYSLDRNGTPNLISAVRGGCSCIYRLGLEPPPKPTDRIYHALVEVRGRPLPHSYRVQFLDDFDRWQRQAVAVLRNPERANDLKIAAALIPIRASADSWVVRVEVALDLDAIVTVPGPDGSRGSWEVGALLANDDGSQQWEMMNISAFRRRGDVRGGQPRDGPNGGAQGDATREFEAPVLHERLVDGLRPGRFTLSVFVRDRVAGVLGGAEAVLELPRARRGTLAGPFLFRPDRRHLLAPLSAFTKKDATESHVTEARTGELPAWEARVSAGEPLEAVTWICPRGKTPPTRHEAGRDRAELLPGSLTRYVMREGSPLFRLSPPRMESAGECVRVTDRLDTSELVSGEYAYVLHWKNTEASEPVPAEVRFSVETSPTSQP